MDAVLAEREDGLDHFIYALKQGGGMYHCKTSGWLNG